MSVNRKVLNIDLTLAHTYVIAHKNVKSRIVTKASLATKTSSTNCSIYDGIIILQDIMQLQGIKGSCISNNITNKL